MRFNRVLAVAALGAVFVMPASMTMAQEEGEKKADKPKRTASDRSQRWNRDWRKFDKDGDGKLSDEEKAEMQKARDLRRKEMIKKYDVDGDGELSAEEQAAQREDRRKAALEEQKKYFEGFDKDGDGGINAEERAAMVEDWAMRRMRIEPGTELTEEQQARLEGIKKQYSAWADAMATRADSNQDGVVTWEESQAMQQKMRQRGEEWQKERRANNMRKYDLDGDGELSEEERKAAREGQRKERQERMKEFDADGDGQLNRDERRAMQKAWRERMQEAWDKKDAEEAVLEEE